MSKYLKLFSLALIVLAFLFGGSWWGFCLGDELFTLFGISSWSNGISGTHYAALFALLPLFAGVFLFPFSKKDSHQNKEVNR